MLSARDCRSSPALLLPGRVAARKTLDHMPVACDFLPLTKSLQQAASGQFCISEVAGMQLVLGNLCLVHLANRTGQGKLSGLSGRVHREA